MPSPSVIATIPVGNTSSVRSVSDSLFLFAGNFSDATISKIDPSTNSVLATITVSSSIEDFCVDGTSIWVADGTLKKYSYTGVLLDTVLPPSGKSFDAPVFFDGTSVWVSITGESGVSNGRIAKVDISSDTYTQVTMGTSAVGPFEADAITSDGTNLIVLARDSGAFSGSSNNRVVRIDQTTNAIVNSFNPGTRAQQANQITYDSSSPAIWVNSPGLSGPPFFDTLKKFDPSTGTLLGTLALPSAGINSPVTGVVFENMSPAVWYDFDDLAGTVYMGRGNVSSATENFQITTGFGGRPNVTLFAFSSIWYRSGTSLYRVGPLIPPAAPPTVTNCFPPLGPTSGGTAVTITGTDFQATPTSITIGGVACSGIVFGSSTSLTAVTGPKFTPGTYNVVVTNPDGQSGTLVNGFQYTITTPTVINVNPGSGTSDGGNTVTVTGTGFVVGATVTFGGNAASSINVQNDSTLTCIVPAGTAGTTVNVVVTNPGPLSGTLVNGYSYLAVPPPPPVVSPWNASNAIVTVAHALSGTYIVLSNRSQSLVTTFFYDMERQIWFQSTAGMVAFTEDLYSGTLAFFYATSDGHIYQGFTGTAPNYGSTPRIQTVFFVPPGGDRQDNKIFQGVHVYGTQAGLSLTVAVDDQSPVPLVIASDPTDVFAQGVDDLFYIPQGVVQTGRLYRITVSWPANSAQPLSAMDAMFSLSTDFPGEVL